jgi:hypothetical protein
VTVSVIIIARFSFKTPQPNRSRRRCSTKNVPRNRQIVVVKKARTFRRIEEARL